MYQMHGALVSRSWSFALPCLLAFLPPSLGAEAPTLESRLKAAANRDRLVAFQWLPNGKEVAYGTKVGPVEHAYVAVNGRTGARRPLFDAKALLSALVAGGERLEALPAFPDLKVETDGSVRFSRKEAWFRFDAKTNRLSPSTKPDGDGQGTGKGHTEAAPGNHNPESPDGRYQVQLRDGNLWLLDQKDDEEYQITSDAKAGKAFEFPVAWSGDSRFVMLFQVEKPETRKIHYVESHPEGSTVPKLHTQEYAKPGDAIPTAVPRLFDMVRRREVPMKGLDLSNPWTMRDLRWLDGIQRFAFVYNRRGHQVMQVVTADPATGDLKAVVDEQTKTFIHYSKSYVCHWLPKTSELLWMSERSGFAHLYHVDLRTGATRAITSGPWEVERVLHVDEAKRELWLGTHGLRKEVEPYYEQIVRVGFDGKNQTVLTDKDGTFDWVSFAPDGQTFATRWSRVDQPFVHEVRRASDGKVLATLEQGDLTPLKAAGWRAPERFVAKGRDGKTDIHGIILRPVDFDPAKRYPVIEDIYAGPHSFHTPKRFSAWQQMQDLANQGFIVVKLDGMGTTGRGKAFHDVAWQNLQDSGFPDRIAWIRAAAVKEPAMDLSRGVGIYGGSAGGQSAMRALLDFGDFYTVAVSDCGCHDNRVDKIWWNEQFLGWPLGPAYKKASNVEDAAKLKGKLMLILPEIDSNVDPASTLQVVDALIKADKDFDLLVVPGENHWVFPKPYPWKRLKAFFGRHLQGR